MNQTQGPDTQSDIGVSTSVFTLSIFPLNLSSLFPTKFESDTDSRESYYLCLDWNDEENGSHEIPRKTPPKMTNYTAIPVDDVTRVGVTRDDNNTRVGVQSVTTNNVTSYFAASNNLTCIDEYSNRKTSQEEGLGELDNNSKNKTLETKSKQQSLEMNGNRVKDSTDGVKQLAASFQNAIYAETEKAKKGMPPPVKPKTYKRVPPPVKSKPNAGKVDQNQNATSKFIVTTIFWYLYLTTDKG